VGGCAIAVAPAIKAKPVMANVVSGSFLWVRILFSSPFRLGSLPAPVDLETYDHHHNENVPRRQSDIVTAHRLRGKTPSFYLARERGIRQAIDDMHNGTKARARDRFGP
jgi:hypothetical protein